MDALLCRWYRIPRDKSYRLDETNHFYITAASPLIILPVTATISRFKTLPTEPQMRDRIPTGQGWESVTGYVPFIEQWLQQCLLQQHTLQPATTRKLDSFRAAALGDNRL